MSKISVDKALEEIKKNKSSTPLFNGAFVLCNADGNPYYIGKTKSGLFSRNIFEKVWWNKNIGEIFSFVDIRKCSEDSSVSNCEDDRYLDELVLKLQEHYDLHSNRKPTTLISLEKIKKELKSRGISLDKRIISRVAKEIGVKWILWDTTVCLPRDEANRLIKEILNRKG